MRRCIVACQQNIKSRQVRVTDQKVGELLPSIAKMARQPVYEDHRLVAINAFTDEGGLDGIRAELLQPLSLAPCAPLPKPFKHPDSYRFPLWNHFSLRPRDTTR